MAEYITKEQAYNSVDERIDELRADKEFNIVKEICISGVKKHIQAIPTADVVEQEKIDEALDETYKIRNEILQANGCYEPNDVIDIIDQITKLFEEL